MKKIILVMAVAVMAVMAMVAIPAYAESQAQFWAKIRNSQSNANRSHGHYNHGCQGRHGHGGVARVVEMKMKDNEAQKYLVVFHDGHIAIACANGKITGESNSPINRDALGVMGVLGALGILVGVH